MSSATTVSTPVMQAPSTDSSPDAPTITVPALPESAFPLILSDLARQHNRPLLFIARDDSRMTQQTELLQFFTPDIPILRFPAWDCLPYDRVSPHTALVSERMEALTVLAALPEDKPAILLTTINALLQRVPPKSAVSDESYALTPGMTLDRAALTHFLTRHGYGRVGKVMEPGEFAIRGSIIDLFPSSSEYAVRMDCFGDEIESLRRFDPLDQVSGDTLPHLALLPASEYRLDEESITRFREGFRRHFGGVYHKSPLYEAVTHGRKHPGMEHWLPLFHPQMDTLTNYMPSATPIIYDHLAEEAGQERLELIQDYYNARIEMTAQKSLGESEPYHALPPDLLYMTADEWQK